MPYSKANPPPIMAEPPGSLETLTETAGYMPAKIRIENLINAGARLDQYRREAYDFGPDSTENDEETFQAPERSYGFDPSDGSIIEHNLKTRLQERSRQRSATRQPTVPEMTLATPPDAPKEA